MVSMNYFVQRKYRVLISLFLLLSVNWMGGTDLFAQKPLNPPKDLGPKSQVDLVNADSLVGQNELTRTFYGNVIFRHRGVLLGCQLAIQNIATNMIEAYGKVIINQGDTLTITGDTLFYEGNTRLARIYGRSVVLRDRKKVTLRTTMLNYNLNNSQAHYPVPGNIVQDSSRLSSNEGYYNTKTKLFKYYGDVEIKNPDFLLCTDSLDYDSNTRQAYFNSPTTIKSKDGDLVANKGTYNTKTKKSFFQGRAKVVNPTYSLEGDTLNFDNETESGLAIGNVSFVSFEDSVRIFGNRGQRFGDIGLTKVMGSAVVEQVSGKDTLFMSGDTLYAYELKDSLNTTKKTGQKTDKKKQLKELIAKGNVKVFRHDFQSISDSLTYKISDSMIVFITEPVLWSRENQLEADTIRIFLKDNRLSSMKLYDNSFVIAVDTVKNFNQIKGRDIEAIFDKQSALQLIKVDGNGESIYFALDDKNKMIGLNRVECSKMRLRFGDKKVKQISFLGNPESRLIPPKEIGTEESKLEDFLWKIDKTPSKKSVIGSKFAYFM
jgi:lipopolysaccharide export system protein LptA